MKTAPVVFFAVLSITSFNLASCSSNQIFIDKTGVDMAQYQQDENQCRQQATGSKDEKLQSTKNCLKSRGYRVEN